MVYLFLSVVVFLVACINMWLVHLLGVRSRGTYLLAAVAAGVVVGGWLGSAATGSAAAVSPLAGLVRGSAAGAAAGLIAGSLILGIRWLFGRNAGAISGEGNDGGQR